MKGLCHSFGGLRALSNFHAALEPREVVGLIGPNGAGKTTVFNLITGVYRPSSGQICFQGRDLVGLSPHRVAQLGIARTFQTIRLYSELSVLENVCLGAHNSLGYGVVGAVLRLPSFQRREAEVQQRARELLDRFRLADKALERAGALSYGDQRRLEICRALAAQPRVLLLDEPAAGMNPTEVRDLVELIRWIQRTHDLTIFLIEHHMEVVYEASHRVVAIDFGEIIAEGTPAEVQTHPRVIEAYLGSSEEAGDHAC